MAKQYPIPQDYNRHIDPLKDEEIEEEDPSINDLFGDKSEWEENEDGSVTVKMAALDGPMQDKGFYENLAEDAVPDSELQSLSLRYLDLIERDKEARRKRDDQYEEGIRRSGLGDDSPGGATFNGASKVVHPVIAEACVDFEARVIKELIPPNGPVKSAILGDTNEAKLARSTRKVDWLNWQLTEQIEEFTDEMEQLQTQLPLGGSQYLKIWYDQTLKRPCVEFLPIDNVYLPYAAASFYSASRVTEVNDITKDEYDDRVENGLYRDLDLTTPSMEPEQSESGKASDKIEGREFDAYNEDGIRRVYHIYCYMKLPSDGEADGERSPYILIIDESSHKVLGLYRNWEKGDKKRKKLDWIIEFRFIPWRGAYGIGLFHLIGSLAIAATGALRALLDSAHISNTPTAMKLRGDRMGGQSKTPEPTEIIEVEGPAGIDDIRKVAMPMPFGPPSPVLFELLGWLTDAAKGVVTTAEEKIADVNSQSPVGTTQALIEQGSNVFSAIHSRQHKSMKRFLKVLARLDRWYIDDMERGEDVVDLDIRSEDFIPTSDVIPVSDPNIFSETQRFAQNTAVMQMAERNIQLQRQDFDMKAVYRRALEQMKVPNVSEVLPDPEDVQEMNPALENVAMTLNKPVGAYPMQDHLAHIQVHLNYATDPIFGSSPIMGPTYVPALMEHMKQHLTLWYLQQTDDYVRMATQQPAETHKVQSIFASMQKVFAAASNHVHMDAQQAFSKAQPIVMKFAKMLADQAQQQQQQMLQDPSAQAMLQSSMAETKRKTTRDQGDLQLGQQKNQIDQQKVQQEGQTAVLDAKTKQQTAQVDAQTKTAGLMIEARIEDQKAQREAAAQQQEMVHDSEEHQNVMAEQQMKAEHQQEAHDQSMAQAQENQALAKQKAIYGGKGDNSAKTA
jgi:chaperonin GroES